MAEDLKIEISGATEGLDKSLKEAESKLKEFASKATSIGKTLSLAVTAPLTGLAALGVVNFNKQVQAIGQVEAALLSTGNAAGKSSQQLQDLASDLQNISLFGDEEILQKVTAQLLTFTNIAGQQFDRTQKAALDLATRLGGDLQGATIQLGKALNDPVANLSALSRSGIQFSEDQKTLINSLVETNRLADAQTIILDELEKQYGGSAEAAAKLGTGPLKQLSNQFGDLLEDVGKIIVQALNPLISRASRLITFFQGLSDTTKTVIVAIGAIAASIGPLLLGIGAVITALPIITAGFTALGTAVTFATGPIGIAVIAITAASVAIIANWEKIKDAFKLGALAIIDSTIAVIKPVSALTNAFPQLKAVSTAAIVGLEALGKRIANSLKKDLEEDASGAVEKLGATLAQTAGKAKLTFEEFSKLSDLANAKVFAQWDAEAKEFNRTLEESISLSRRLERAIDSIDVNKALGITQIVDVNVDLGGVPVVEVPEIDESSRSRFLASLQQFRDEASFILSNGISNALGDFAFSIGDAIGRGESVLKSAGAALLSGIAQIANQLGQAAIAIGVGMIAIRKAFTNPITAIAAGTALVALAGFISSQVPRIVGQGGASSVGTSAVGQGASFQGGGVQFVDPNREIKLVAETDGAKLRYVIDQSQFYRN